MPIRRRTASKNIFRDLGFEPAEAENLLARSDLMIRLTKVIESRGLSQQAAAKLMHVTQPRISDLIRGMIDRFSIDSLVEMLGHLDITVHFVLRQRNKVA